jgi:hypothetical protein
MTHPAGGQLPNGFSQSTVLGQPEKYRVSAICEKRRSLGNYDLSAVSAPP